MINKILRRNTQQRKIILEELSKVKTHPDADAIFRTVRRRIANISIGTVYRNLNLLRDQGNILELTCGKHRSHYDADITSHCHFFCLSCENIFDLNKPSAKYLDTKVSKYSGMKVKYHRIDFYGYCADCKDNRSYR